MTSSELRQALGELTGQRAATFFLAGVGESACALNVPNAMLVPQEDDNLVKVTDGQSIYIIDAERVAWIRIGLAEPKIK